MRIINIGNEPELIKKASAWFAEKWDIPQDAYEESMEEAARNDSLIEAFPAPRWYVAVDKKGDIAAGAGVIENDFHERKDLRPNLCALFVEEDRRGEGTARKILEHIRKDMAKAGVKTLYLVTDHTKLYEKLGWRFITMTKGEDGMQERVYGIDCGNLVSGDEEKTEIKVREYRPSDCEILAKLFYDTVHTVNCADYSRAQLDAWAPGKPEPKLWNERFSESYTFVAEQGGIITGFGNIEKSGYLDMLYVHKDYQRQKVASSICDVVEKYRQGDIIYTYASITAKPFFEKRGYKTAREQRVKRAGIYLKNYLMEKDFSERTMPIVIRRFEKRDMDKVMDIWLASNIQAHWFVDSQYWKDNYEPVKQLLPQAELYVCCCGETVLGFAGLDGDHIEGIFVSEGSRSRGIGKKLLDYLKKNRKALTLNVYKKNKRAVRFYAREGFTVLEEGKDDFTGERDILMGWRKADEQTFRY